MIKFKNLMEANMKSNWRSNSNCFGLGAFTTTATAETIVTADVLNVRENRLQNQKWSKK